MSSSELNNRSHITNKRDPNIELLRTLTMIGVIVLHMNNPLVGKCLLYSRDNSFLYGFLLGYESLFVCAVNLFLVITGYYMIRKKSVSLIKPFLLVSQVCIFSISYYVAVNLLRGDFSVRGVLESAIPKNYFVIIYCSLYLLSPFINKLLNSLNARQYTVLMVIICFLFSFVPTILDSLKELKGINVQGLYPEGMFGSGYGYTFINFLMMYMWGGFIRTIGEIRTRTYKLLVILIVSIVLLSAWSHFTIWEGDFVENSSISYCNPLIVLNAVLVFILFTRIEIRNLKVGCIINCLAKNCFSVYLLHNYILGKIDYYSLINQYGTLFALIILIIGLVIFFICCLVGYIYSLTAGRTIAWIADRISCLKRTLITVD